MAKIEEKLHALGETAEEVASTLLSKGCFGSRASATRCPVLKYICTFFPYGSLLRSPHPGVITWDDPQILDPHCPTPVKEFMKRFDLGEFTELVEQ